ncbi:MAG TPA: hypothetical protein VGV89_09525 [Thermoplasmata archaeon]|nr:hypothetical protein [Thermoplasmata archaeon]
MSEDDLQLRIAGLEKRVAVLEAGLKSGPPASSSPSKPETVREFLNRLAPKTAVDTALGIAVWLEQHGTVNFTTDEIVAAFGQAKEPTPGNPSDLLYQNGRRGYMAPAAEKKNGSKAYFVTNTGTKFANAGFKD